MILPFSNGTTTGTGPNLGGTLRHVMSRNGSMSNMLRISMTFSTASANDIPALRLNRAQEAVGGLISASYATPMRYGPRIIRMHWTGYRFRMGSLMHMLQ